MFSSMSMGQKAGSGLTSAIMGGILSAAYFDGTKATAAEQSTEAIRVIKGFYLYVPNSNLGSDVCDRSMLPAGQSL